MKSVFSRWSSLGLAVLMLALQACGSSTEPSAPATTTENEAPKTKVALSETTQTSVASVLDGYFGLKDAMVTSDADQVRAAAETLLGQIEAFDFSGETAAELSNLVDAVRFGVTNVREAETIDAQREYLPALTENMKNLIEGYQVTDASVYVQFCPMAFDNKGAYWLSNSDEVVNPYFGDVMLHCGRVTETL